MTTIDAKQEYTDRLLATVFRSVFEEHRNCFITGSGGTGKSWLIRQIINEAKSRQLNVAATSSTGTSAIHLSGTTIHSWSSAGLGKDSSAKVISRMRASSFKKWKSCNLLIIDEISMVGKKLFELVDDIGKSARNCSKPFGGLQLIMSGDFLQIPPINDLQCFLSEVWTQLDLVNFKLVQPYRFTDPAFFDMLQRVRKGKLSDSDLLQLEPCRQKLDQWKQDYTSGKNKNDKDLQVEPTFLFPLRKDVDAVNKHKLEKLDGKLFKFEAHDIGDKSILKSIESSCPSDIFLKVGAQVMLTQNLSIERKLVNGSRGVVLSCCLVSVLVKFASGLIESIPKVAFEVEEGTQKAARHQIPLRLSWSTSIHASQGASIDSVIIDFGKVFQSNMAYVALSRTRSFDSLMITNISQRSIWADQQAIDFDDQIEEFK